MKEIAVDDVVQKVIEMTDGMVKLFKIWEPPAPNSSYESQEIKKNVEGYDFIIMTSNLSATDKKTQAALIPKGCSGTIQNHGTINGRASTTYRHVTLSAGNKGMLTVGGGMYFNDVVNSSSPNYCIPQTMYGLKIIPGGGKLANALRRLLKRGGLCYGR